MLTNRDAISQLRDSLKEKSADSTYSNQFLYNILMKHAAWIVRREVSAGRIYRNNYIFQTLTCFDIMEVSPIDKDCDIKTACKIYRTVRKLPKLFQDENGAIIKEVKSIDGSEIFTDTNSSNWSNIESSPYFKYNKTNYYIYMHGHLFFPVKAPKKIVVVGYFVNDVSNEGTCGQPKKCSKFMDDYFRIPEWLEGEIFGKALEELAGITKKMPEDEQIDSNPTRKS